MIFSKKKGFTLIELLIVVAIIGILATIVMVATGDARKKGKDAAIKSNLDTIRKQAAIWYFDNNTYLYPAKPDERSETSCNNISDTGNNQNTNHILGRDPIIFEALQDAISKGYNPVASNDSRCAVGATSWAVAVRLPSGGDAQNTSKSWCVDSDGFSGFFTGHTNNQPPHAVCTDTSGANNRYFCADSYPCP